jgi:hypothetical protein
MPRFYIHIRRNGERIEDSEGVELHDLGAAVAEAKAAAREWAADRVRRGLEPDQAIYEISDSQGKLLVSLNMRDAVSL